MYKRALPYFILTAALLQYGCKKEAAHETKNRPPGSFDLISVPDKQMGTDVLPTLSWQRSNDPDNDKVRYDLILEAANGETLTAAVSLEDTFYIFNSRLETNTYYRWKVEAKDEKGGIRASTSTFGLTTRSMHAPQVANASATSLSRMGHSTVVFKDKIWVIGGAYAPEEYNMNDIWSSVDGITWESVNASAPFQPRSYHSSVVFDNKMWVIGGTGNSLFQDIWYSENGVNWIQATVPPFGKRHSCATVVYHDKIWVIGGISPGPMNDVWYSENGKNWILAVENAPFSKRSALAAIVFQDKIWVISGWDHTATGSIWYSENGSDWTLATDNPAFGKRRGHTVTVFDNKLWLIGGSAPIGASSTFYLPKNDVWVSKDGINWTQFFSIVPFQEREFHTAIAHRNKLLVLFGGSETKSFNDVWSIE